VPWNYPFPPGTDGPAAFPVAFPYLVRHCVSKSQPPPRAHYPRIPDAFTAGHVTGWIYLP